MPHRQSPDTTTDKTREPTEQQAGGNVAPVVGASVGERIAAALVRAGRGGDVRWLADQCGVRWQTAQFWLTGESEPKGANAKRIAEVLAMDPLELLGIMDGQDPPFLAWQAFLMTREGESMTPDERLSAQSIRWTRGRQPTVASYLMALATLRSAEPRE
jgi:hypothetical protein